MNKNALFACFAAAMLAGAAPALAQISMAANPSSQSVAGGSTFDVSFTLTVPQSSNPSDVIGFDLYLVTADANSGYFSITAATPNGGYSSSGPDDSAGDPLNTAAASGFVRNGIDQGFSGSAQATPLSGVPLVRLTLAVAPGTPANTYTFSTSTTANAGAFFSDVGDSSNNVYEVTSPGTFSINVVPEPATGPLVIVAGLSLAGLGVWRRRAVVRQA